MSQMIINEKNGFETVFSTDPTSPAAPYIRAYQPRTIQDLYDIGVIPKSVPFAVLQATQAAGLKVQTTYTRLTSPTFQGMPALNARKYVEATRTSLARQTATQVTSEMLVAQHGYSKNEADLISRKVHSLTDFSSPLSTTVTSSPVFVTVALPDDLIVKSPLVIDASVHSVTAKDVHIFSTGAVRVMSGYFLLSCDSIRGEGFWWRDLLTTTVTEQPPVRIGS